VKRSRKIELFGHYNNLFNKMYSKTRLGLLILHAIAMIPCRRVTYGELRIVKFMTVFVIRPSQPFNNWDINESGEILRERESAEHTQNILLI